MWSKYQTQLLCITRHYASLQHYFYSLKENALIAKLFGVSQHLA